MRETFGLDLVTGGAGFIGSHLVDRLINDGRRVRVLDNFIVGRRANLAQHEGDPRLEIVEGDVADFKIALRATEGVERVFHLAARADIVPSIREPEAYFRANVDGTFAVLEAARRRVDSALCLCCFLIMLRHTHALSRRRRPLPLIRGTPTPSQSIWASK